MQNFYEVLEITRDATDQEIKVAWRRLAKVYHPDVSSLKDAEAKFKILNEAYQTLSNPTTRDTYNSKLDYERSNGSTSGKYSQETETVYKGDFYKGTTYRRRSRQHEPRRRPGAPIPGSWTMIKYGPYSGRWGVWVKANHNPKAGDTVIAKSKAGNIKIVRIAAIVVSNGEYTLCAVIG